MKEKQIKQSFVIGENELNAFREACISNDTSMSREIRRFIKSYVTTDFDEGWLARVPQGLKKVMEDKYGK